MNDETMRKAWSSITQRPDREGCVTPEALLAVVERRTSESERLDTLVHVGSCAACRSDLDLLRTARDAAHATVKPVRRFAYPATAAALLLAAGAALWQILDTPRTDTLRDAPVVLRLLTPTDVTGDSVELVWSSVPGADRYAIEILTEDGALVHSDIAMDTTLVVSQLSADVDYLWWVRAIGVDGTAARSATRPLRIRSP